MVRREAQSSAGIVSALKYIIALFTMASLLMSGACGASGNKGPLPSASKTSGTAALKKGPIRVVASVNQWGLLAQQLGGTQVQVTSILRNTNVDAHDFSPTSSDISTVTNAQVLVVNGAGYDSWATKPSTKALSTVNAASTIGAEAGDNPHLWFSSDVRAKVAQSIRDAYISALPSQKDYFTKLYDQWKAKEESLKKVIARFAKKYSGKPYAATESVAYYLMADLGLKDMTPKGYSTAMQNESEPSATDLQSFQTLIEQHRGRLVISNPQEGSDAVNMVLGTAGRADVPVVEVTEQVPDKYKTLDEWITALTGDFTKAMESSENNEVPDTAASGNNA